MLGSTDPYRGLLAAVVASQAQLIAAWMSVGFIHGVMNTDNITISGETIDYGPCAFLDRYDDQTVFSSIDTGGRYRFANQPPIAAWNLSRFAESLLPLLAGDADQAVQIASAEIERFWPSYDRAWHDRLRLKLGLMGTEVEDQTLIADLLSLMAVGRLDFTLTWRGLARDLRGDAEAVRGELIDLRAYDEWRARWLARLGEIDLGTVADRMDRVNPAYIPRNHLVEDALAAARSGDFNLVTSLLAVVTRPYDEQSDLVAYLAPAPEAFTDSYLTYCGT